MWPFGKKQRDYDGVALSLLQEGAKYQVPTVDGIIEFLEATGQLQYREEMTEKKRLNAAAACVVAEHVLLRAERSFGAGSTEHTAMIRDHLYAYVKRLVDDSNVRVDAGRKLLARIVPEAAKKFPPSTPHPGDPRAENLTYELVRAVVRLHMEWASLNGSSVNLPTSANDSRQLATAGDGMARAQRWIETSVLKALTQTVKP